MSKQEETNLSEEEYLRKHIESLESSKTTNQPTATFQPEIGGTELVFETNIPPPAN